MGGIPMTDDLSYRQLADHLADAEDAAAALAAGHLSFSFDAPLDAPAPQPELPPPGAPVSVVRPVRLSYEVDAAVKAIAEARGITVSALIREWVQNGLASSGKSSDAPDPVTELRQGLNSALRALDSLTAKGIRPAA
jgi:hypothetical protein